MFKFITEVLPLIAFFVGYKTGGVLTATSYILIASIFNLILIYALKREVSKVNLVSTIILLISGGLTLTSGNSMFIKIKPTILYFVFGIAFLVTNYRWQPAIKLVFKSAIALKTEEAWKILNMKFMWFFFMMAVLNELIWRNFSEGTWVNFKVFGALPITLIFVMLQIPFILRNKMPDQDFDEAN